MLVRVKIGLLGPDGALAVTALPTWGMIGIDPVEMTATVNIPDEDYPVDAPAPGHPFRPNTPYGPVLIDLDAAALIRWHAQIDARYPQRVGQFRPRFR